MKVVKEFKIKADINHTSAQNRLLETQMWPVITDHRMLYAVLKDIVKILGFVNYQL